MAFLGEGAGERTQRAYAEGVRSNEELRHGQRLEAADRVAQHNAALAEYRSAQKHHAQWHAEDLKWKSGEYNRECLAAMQEGRAKIYSSPADVADLPGEPYVGAMPELDPYVAPKRPMGLGVGIAIIAAIIVGWLLVGDFVAYAYIVGVFAVPAGYAAIVGLWLVLRNRAAGDAEKLASLERWNPLALGLRALLWSGKMLGRLVWLGLRKL